MAEGCNSGVNRQVEMNALPTPLELPSGGGHQNVVELAGLKTAARSSEGYCRGQGHARSASGGSLSDIGEGSVLKTGIDDPLLTSITTHCRSPSDESLHQQQQQQTAAARSHRRTPSDISLSTLAAIRGTYHKRTASDVSARAAAAARGHQRAASDGASPYRIGHQRTDSAGTNSSQLLDVGSGSDGVGPLGSADDISLLSAGND